MKKVILFMLLIPFSGFAACPTNWIQIHEDYLTTINGTCPSGSILGTIGECTSESISTCYVTSCEANYYYDGTSCQQCPGGGKSPGGAGDITSCYLPANTEFTDEHGNKYYFDADCAHTASE